MQAALHPMCYATHRHLGPRFTHVIRPGNELQSNDMSKETRRVFGNRANSCIFYQTVSEGLLHGFAPAIHESSLGRPGAEAAATRSSEPPTGHRHELLQYLV